MQTSWRPFIPTDGVGLIAMRILIVFPVEIPPSVAFLSLLFSLPPSDASLIPRSISKDLTAPIESSAFARSASSLSKTGSPRFFGGLFTSISTNPPDESPFLGFLHVVFEEILVVFGKIILAIAPPSTLPIVSRPDARPPPL